MSSKTPTTSYGDSYTLGQLARHWQKPPIFVQRMIDEDKLVVDERGLIINSALHGFYKNHGIELDA